MARPAAAAQRPLAPARCECRSRRLASGSRAAELSAVLFPSGGPAGGRLKALGRVGAHTVHCRNHVFPRRRPWARPWYWLTESFLGAECMLKMPLSTSPRPSPPTHTPLKPSRGARSPEVRLLQIELEIVGTSEGCVISGFGDKPEFKLPLHPSTPCTDT